MPNGRTHDIITVICTVPVSVIAGAIAYLTDSPTVPAIAIASFVFSGFMFSPDLDTNSYPFKRWLWLRFIWIPYKKILHHRSTWSHGAVIGTAVRVCYLFCWIALAVLGHFMITSTWMSLEELNLVVSAHDWENCIKILGHCAKRAIVHWAGWLLWLKTAIMNHPVEVIAGGVGLELGSASHYIADTVSTYWKRHHGR